LWSRRRFLSLAALPALAACGFAPAYGPGGPGRALRGRVAVAPPDDRIGFAFAAALEDRLGTPGAAAYGLDWRIATRTDARAVTGGGETLRYFLTGTLAYDLTGPDGGRAGSGEITAFTAWSAIGTTVAARASERDAERRLATILADRLVTRLLATLPAAP
jgi:LPS-assembly lipoprotein